MPGQNPKVTADRAFNGFGTNYEGSPEPIYGQLFLPRKFKIAVTGEQSYCALAACCSPVRLLLGCSLPALIGWLCAMQCCPAAPLSAPA